MNQTLALKLILDPVQPWSEILVAELAELNFDSFEEIENGIVAYGDETKINRENLIKETSLNSNLFKYEISIDSIPYQNWNELWEKDFEPVFVGENLSILAPFHDKKLQKKISIEIQPQTSFGTGHHQTTWLMSKAMLDLKPFPDKILDMGTGTGVLAILAEKLGASSILAIDIEDWSVENAIENCKRNNCLIVSCFCGEVELLENKTFDLILANINKNVLKSQMNSYKACISEKGLLFLSGFFDSDANEMIDFCRNYDFVFLKKIVKETWVMLQFIKK